MAPISKGVRWQMEVPLGSEQILSFANRGDQKCPSF